MLPEQTHQLIPGFLLKTEQSYALRRAKAHGLPSPGSPCHQSRADTGAADPTRPSAQAHRTPSTEAVPLQGLRTQALQPSSWCWQALSKNLCSCPSRHLSEFAISHVTGTSFILCTFSASFPSCTLPPEENPGLSTGHSPFPSISESVWGAGCEAAAGGTERNVGRAGRGAAGEARGEAEAGEMQGSTLPGQKGAALRSDLTLSQIKPNVDCGRSQTEKATGSMARPACQHVTCGQDVHQKEIRMKGRGAVKS